MFIDYKLNVVKLLDQINENDEEFLIYIYTLIYIHVFGRED